MDKSLVKSLVVTALGSAAYYGAASAALPWAPALTGSTINYLTLQLANSTVLVALSLPFAALFGSRFLKLRSPIVVAVAVALLGLLAPSVSSLPLVLRPWPAGASAALDLVKFAAVLPVLTWAAIRWLPSNNSFKPTPLRGAA
jgi:hypothetical protein